ncbi:MAG: hypothetical protein UY96_C0017G0009 [Parcubacteria group bacterium GW2011_GWB1_56_8]|nr:MAG: hypothetical protein UY96_C0017G0009 [Parcubacteria group bacterium GW2011_GWB1_56_8]
MLILTITYGDESPKVASFRFDDSTPFGDIAIFASTFSRFWREKLVRHDLAEKTSTLIAIRTRARGSWDAVEL